MEAMQPPLPPEIATQQGGSPLMQYAQGGGMASAQQTTQQVPSMELAQGLLGQIGDLLNKLATILVNERPELVTLLKPTLQSLSMLESNIKTAQGGAPQGGDAGTANASSAQAPGPAAMGMGQ